MGSCHEVVLCIGKALLFKSKIHFTFKPTWIELEATGSLRDPSAALIVRDAVSVFVQFLNGPGCPDSGHDQGLGRCRSGGKVGLRLLRGTYDRCVTVCRVRYAKEVQAITQWASRLGKSIQDKGKILKLNSQLIYFGRAISELHRCSL